MTSPWGGSGIFLEETQKVKHAGLIYETSVDFQLYAAVVVVTEQCKNGGGRFKTGSW